MKNSFKILLLCTLILAAGCNEEISPDLQSAATASGTSDDDDPVVVPPEEYYFRVTNTSDTMLNYQLHKTGDGNGAVDCEISGATEFTSANYIASQSTYDISCFFEAEELAMHFNGLSFQVESSANTCDYVAYSPFSYFNYIPGDSTTRYKRVRCADQAADADVAAYGGNIASLTECDSMIDIGGVANAPAEFESPTSDQELCRFDHSTVSGAPNCDIGTITIDEYTLTGDGSATSLSSAVTTTVDCGGEVYNCVKGPIRLHSELDESIRGSILYQPTVNEDFTNEYELPKLLNTKQHQSLNYANFRRNLSSLNIDFEDGSPTDLSPLTYDPVGTYLTGADSFGGATYKDDFTTTLMDYYSNNLRMNGTTRVIPNGTWEASDDGTSPVKAYYSKAFAAEPFLGRVDDNYNYRVNPFYTFYCLDRAYDVKARIRMVVREWDRIYGTSQDFEGISDVHLGATARMDNPTETELPNDFDSFNNFNDRVDWDDLIPMERTAAIFAAGVTEWTPKSCTQVPPAAPVCSNGWWSDTIFPRYPD